jgi:hypothetical protein
MPADQSADTIRTSLKGMTRISAIGGRNLPTRAVTAGRHSRALRKQAPYRGVERR